MLREMGRKKRQPRKAAATEPEICGAGLLWVALRLRKPAPRSQGCEGARVLLALDTEEGNKFPAQWNEKGEKQV
jgi:hypothetical protein